MFSRRQFVLSTLGAVGLSAALGATVRAMSTAHTIVLPGEGFLAVAARVAPPGITPAQRLTFARAIANASNLNYDTAVIHPGQVLHYDTASVPQPATPTPPPPPPPPPPVPPTGTHPTAASTGVRIATTGTNTFRTSGIPGTTRSIGGRTYKVISGLRFGLDTEYVYADDPAVLFEDCAFVSTGLVSNTSAMVQAGSGALNGLRFEHCTFDGGPKHNRNAQSDYGLVAIACNCTRFGNAAFEMNNRGGNADMEVRDCYLFEPVGWQPADHTDGIQVGGGRNVTIANNTVLVTSHNSDGGASNSCLGLWAELGNVTGAVLVEGNLLAGGGRIMYLEQKAPYAWQGPVTVRNNTFSKRFEQHGGIWGILHPNGLPANLVWLNNAWEDGTAVSLADAKASY